MFKLLKNDFIKYLNNGCIFTLADNKVVKAEFKYFVDFDEKSPESKVKIVCYYIDDKKIKRLRSLIRKLHIKDIVEINKINDCISMDQYNDKILLQNGDMSYLLTKYSNANMFSLSHEIYNETHITKNEYESIKNESIDRAKKTLLGIYNKYNYTEKDFDTLFNDILNECIEKKDLYLHDKLGINTKYKEPREMFWHFYHSACFILNHINILDKCLETKEANRDLILDKYEELKPFVKREELYFGNHTTLLSNLDLTYYFELNDETKKWLLKHSTIYDFENDLWDLAFYIGDKIIFSSCTHEMYHDDHDN